MAYYPSARRLILPIRFMVRCVRIMLCPDNLWTSEYRRTCARVEGAVVDVGAHLIVAPAFPAGRAVARVLVQPVGAGGGATTNDDVSPRWECPVAQSGMILPLLHALACEGNHRYMMVGWRLHIMKMVPVWTSHWPIGPHHRHRSSMGIRAKQIIISDEY